MNCFFIKVAVTELASSLTRSTAPTAQTVADEHLLKHGCLTWTLQCHGLKPHNSARWRWAGLQKSRDWERSVKTSTQNVLVNVSSHRPRPQAPPPSPSRCSSMLFILSGLFFLLELLFWMLSGTKKYLDVSRRCQSSRARFTSAENVHARKPHLYVLNCLFVYFYGKT